MSDNKAKSSTSITSYEPSFFKSRIFISIVLAIVFFLMGYVFAQSPKSAKGSKSGKGKNQKKTSETPSTKNKKK